MKDKSKYYGLIDDFIRRAVYKNSFGALCALLRVGGMSTSNWDPFEESRKGFDDFFWMMDKAIEERTDSCQHRIALAMYCQAVEMSAPHEILANLTRILSGQPYVIQPLSHLGRSKKNDLFFYVPPSAKVKFRYICKQLRHIDEIEIADMLEHIYSDSIRNSFTHSDYIITEDEYRYTEGKLAASISLDELIELINDCYDFIVSFMSLHKEWLIRLSKLKKYHKWPNYEILELFSDENGVYGFSVHFSNGSKATYSRRPSGVDAINVMFEKDGTVNFMCGFLDKLEKLWKIDGVEVSDWSEIS